MGYYFSGPNGQHEHADTVHEDRDCSHVQKADGRVYPISDVPEDAKVCGTCGSAGNGSDSGADGDDADDVEDGPNA